MPNSELREILEEVYIEGEIDNAISEIKLLLNKIAVEDREVDLSGENLPLFVKGFNACNAEWKKRIDAL